MQCTCLFLVSITLLLGHSYAQTPIELMLSANEVTAGDQLTVTCNTSSPTASVDLEINGVPIMMAIASDRFDININGALSTWTINPVQREDAGMYVCVAAANDPDDADSVDQTLIVYFGPFFSYDGQEQMNGASFNVTAIETSIISITCNVTATNPNLTSLNLTTPPAANNVNFEEGTGVITITEVTFDNAGTYICTAGNGKTIPTTINFVLMVNSLPSTTSSTALIPATSMSPHNTPMPPVSPTPMLQASPTPNSAGNVLATVTVTTVMLFAILLFS